MRLQVVTPPFLEFRDQVAGPVGFIYLEAVAEDRIRRILSESLHEPVTDILEISFHSRAIVMADNESLRTYRGTFDHLSGMARDKKDNFARAFGIAGNLDGSLFDGS